MVQMEMENKEMNSENINNEQVENNNPNSELNNEQSNVDSASESNAEMTENGQNELDEIKAELAEANDKFLRLYSEFDNFKRRSTKERIELMQNAGQEIIKALLPVVDDFQRQEKYFKPDTDVTTLKEGVDLIHNKLTSILQNKGLNAIESLGKEFDTDFHEAITKIPAPSEDLKGKVVDEIEKGYVLNGKVIRFAKVVVGE